MRRSAFAVLGAALLFASGAEQVDSACPDNERRSGVVPETPAGGLLLLAALCRHALGRRGGSLSRLSALWRAIVVPDVGVDVAPIRFGSWIGGDRDGNPTVSPAVTTQACLLAWWLAADLFYKEITALRIELSLREGSAELRARVGPVPEPYRVIL